MNIPPFLNISRCRFYPLLSLLSLLSHFHLTFTSISPHFHFLILSIPYLSSSLFNFHPLLSLPFLSSSLSSTSIHFHLPTIMSFQAVPPGPSRDLPPNPGVFTQDQIRCLEEDAIFLPLPQPLSQAPYASGKRNIISPGLSKPVFRSAVLRISIFLLMYQCPRCNRCIVIPTGLRISPSSRDTLGNQAVERRISERSY